MTNFEFLAFLFVGFLAAIVFGVFVGLAIADRRLQRQQRKYIDATIEAVAQAEKLNDRINALSPGFARSRTPEDVLEAEEIE